MHKNILRLLWLCEILPPENKYKFAVNFMGIELRQCLPRFSENGDCFVCQNAIPLKIVLLESQCYVVREREDSIVYKELCKMYTWRACSG